jgi:hypothetical protein
VLVAPERRRDASRSLLVRLDGVGGARVRLEVLTVPPDDADRLDRFAAATACASGAVAPARRAPADAARRSNRQRLDATGSVKVRAWSAHRLRRTRSAVCSMRPMSPRCIVSTAPSTRRSGTGGIGAMLLGDRGLLDADTNALPGCRPGHLLSISGCTPP